jgi:hypothetical protein
MTVTSAPLLDSEYWCDTLAWRCPNVHLCFDDIPCRECPHAPCGACGLRGGDSCGGDPEECRRPLSPAA